MAQFKIGDKVKDKGTRQLYDVVGFNGTLMVIKDVKTNERYLCNQDFYSLVDLPKTEPTKTADDMFAELGWKYKDARGDKNWVGYVKDISIIGFNLLDKEWTSCANTDEETLDISVNLHKAITKKLEELGWL